MKKMLAASWVALLLMGITAVVFAAKAPDVKQILTNIDNQTNFINSDFSAVLTMVTESPEKGIEKNVVRMFRRDKEDKFLLLFQEPQVKKGQGYLRVDDNLWFYDPESRKFSHTSMKENFQGTDAKNSDFGKSTLAKDYSTVSVSEGKLGNYDVYIIELKANNSEVTYPFLKLWVSKSPNLVLKTEEYSLSKRLLRTSLFPSYAKAGNSYIATTMIFTDELVKGNKTQISITDISLDKLPDTVFTKSYVERVNR